jgi:hypothetical protein
MQEGTLWRPNKSLLKRAQAARQRACQPHAIQKAFQPPIAQLLDLTLDPPQNAFDMPMIGDTMSQMSHTPYPLFGSSFFSLTDIPLSTTETFDEKMNWNDWNEFVLDVHALSPPIAPNAALDPSMQG